MSQRINRDRPRKDKTGKDHPAGLPARRVAIQTFEEVLQKGQPFEEVFDRLAFALPALDRGLAHRIALTSFRRLGHLRQIIASKLEKPLPEGLSRLQACMITGAAQILFMDIPDHAAVDCAVTLVQGDSRSKGFSGLANAILRAIARERETILAGLVPSGNLPDWLAASWRATYGETALEEIATACLDEGTLDLSVKSSPQVWADRLGGIVLPTGSVRLNNQGAIPALEGYEAGEWWVQDAAASLPVLLFSALSGKNAADFCAAPGGKTAQLVVAGANVTAFDRSATRLRRLEDNLRRLKLTAEVITADAASLDARFNSHFDAILLDAPCSSTGTLRGHPDIAWLKSPADVASLANLQARLLDRAVDCLKPGGELVYATCSLEPEEGEEQIAACLRKHPAMRVDVASALQHVALKGFTAGNYGLRILPSSWHKEMGIAGGIDGFFVTRLVKTQH